MGTWTRDVANTRNLSKQLVRGEGWRTVSLTIHSVHENKLKRAVKDGGLGLLQFSPES